MGRRIPRHWGSLALVLEGMVGGKNHRERPRLQYVYRLMDLLKSAIHNRMNRQANDRETRELLQTYPRIENCRGESEQIEK